jgi:pimeloyl-ACP methyl ester carboxylesterase
MIYKVLKNRFFIFLFFLFSVILTGLYFYVPKFVIEVKNPLIWTAKKYLYDKGQDRINNYKADNQTIKIKTFDGLILQADIYKISDSAANIIVLHGIRSNRQNMKNLCMRINQNQYNAIALDLRAHGASQGEYTTFGYYEKKDISLLIDRLISDGWKGDFGIWGHSLGGAVALQTLATDKRLRFGIIESAYADFKEITNDYSEHFLGFASENLNDFLLMRAGEMAHFPVDAVNPVDYASKINVPVWIAHGSKDMKINPENAIKIYKALPSENHKKLTIVKGANHNNIHRIGGNQYFGSVFNFIKKSIRNRNAIAFVSDKK